MAYAIMRTKKLKSTGSIISSGRHNERLIKTPNADEKINNIILIGEKEKTYLEYFKEKTKDVKIRKNAVYAIECFMSVSPEAKFLNNKDKILEWANDSVNWAKKEFGETNIVKAHLHLDETTPHIHVFIVPMYKEKLNAKKFIGGHKSRLSDLQTTYHEAVKQYGLERGLEGSKAKHKDVKKYYTALNNEVVKELPQPKILESKDKYRDRANKEYKNLVLQGLNKDLKIQKLQEQVPKRKSIRKQLNNKKQIEDIKIMKFLDLNPQVRKNILEAVEKKTLNKNKTLEQER
jgi:hypothetical protein